MSEDFIPFAYSTPVHGKQQRRNENRNARNFRNYSLHNIQRQGNYNYNNNAVYNNDDGNNRWRDIPQGESYKLHFNNGIRNISDWSHRETRSYTLNSPQNFNFARYNHTHNRTHDRTYNYYNGTSSSSTSSSYRPNNGWKNESSCDNNKGNASTYNKKSSSRDSNTNIDDYLHPSMLEDPWAHFEKKK